MADLTIFGLDRAILPVRNTDVMPIVQTTANGAETRRVSVSDLLAATGDGGGIQLADNGEVSADKAVRANDNRLIIDLGINPNIDNIPDGRYIYIERSNPPITGNLRLVLYTDSSQSTIASQPIRISTSNWDLAAFLQVRTLNGIAISANDLQFTSSNLSICEVLPSRGVLGRSNGCALITVNVVSGAHAGASGTIPIQVGVPSFLENENFLLIQNTADCHGYPFTTQFRIGQLIETRSKRGMFGFEEDWQAIGRGGITEETGIWTPNFVHVPTPHPTLLSATYHRMGTRVFISIRYKIHSNSFPNLILGLPFVGLSIEQVVNVAINRKALCSGIIFEDFLSLNIVKLGDEDLTNAIVEINGSYEAKYLVKIMEAVKKTTIRDLTERFVNIGTIWFEISEDQKEVKPCNHAVCYANSPSGRTRLQDEQPQNIVDSVMAIWGDTPTVEDPKLSKEEV